MPDVILGKNIAKALFTFQCTVPNIKKSSDNPFFHSDYAALEDILPIIQPVMKVCDLAFTQIPIGKNQLRTIIIHIESGESFEGTVEFTPTKTDPQGQGSGITYMRRYALVAMLGLNCEKDDDGNAVSGNNPPLARPKAPPRPMTPKEARITAETEISKSKTLEQIEKVSKKVSESKLLTAEDKDELGVRIFDRRESIELSIDEHNGKTNVSSKEIQS